MSNFHENHLDDLRWEEAYIRACELDSPNSLDFDSLEESIYEKLVEDDWCPPKYSTKE